MKRYAYIKNGNVENIGALPVDFKNVSNFNILSDEEVKPYGWFPIETISDNKDVIISTEYIIDENCVKEIVNTRDKTQEEIDDENTVKIESEWQIVRQKRNQLLSESDVNVVSDKWEIMSTEDKAKWSEYRIALRNIPQSFSNPSDVVFPQKPL